MNSKNSNICISDTVSQAIKNLRFPLSALVVLEHYYPNKCVQVIPSGSIDVYTPFAKFLSIYLPTFAVPLFFLISGYLFFFSFKSSECFNYRLFKNKLKSRGKTLFIPYLLWNLIMLLLLVLGQYLSHDKIMPFEKPLSNINCVDIISAFWALSDKGFPIDGPLWFIRDLMVVLLFAPIIYFVIKKCKTVGIIVLSIIYLLGINFNLPYFPRTGLFYVTLGGYFALSKNDILTNLCKVNYKLTTILLVGSIISLLLASYYELPKMRMEQVRGAFEFFMVFIIWSPTSYFLSKIKRPFLDKLSTSSFFVYAAHKPIIYGCCIATFTLLSPCSNWTLCILTIIIPITVIFICLILFWLVKKYLPFLRCLNGYRL